MKTLFVFLTIAQAFAQNYASYNGQPVARVSFLRSQIFGAGNVLRDPSLFLYFPANAASTGNLGTIYDGSSNGFTAALQGTQQALSQGGQRSKATYENKNVPNSYLLSPNPTLGTGAFTLSVWAQANCPGSGGFARIVDNDYTLGFYLGSDSPATHYNFVVHGTFATGSSSTSPSGGAYANCSATNPWQMVTGVYTGSAITLYVNGTAVAGPTTVATAPTSAAMSGALRFGGCGLASYCAATGNGWWDGGAQSFRYYKRALTAGEIAAIYAAENH